MGKERRNVARENQAGRENERLQSTDRTNKHIALIKFLNTHTHTNIPINSLDYVKCKSDRILINRN